MSETELLQTFRENQSEEAFTQLVRRYAGLVYSVAKRRLANAALAEDVTQMVFIRLAKTPPNVRDDAQLSAWLHRTAVHVTIDTWRSESRRRQREQQVVLMEPVENAVWEDISPNLDEALNRLDEDDRQAILLRFFGRLSMREVGAGLCVSEDAAKMRVSRAVDRLRTQLGVGAACTAALLTTLLTERSVEAVPSALATRLAAIRLPSLAGTVAVGGLFSALRGVSGFQLATGLLILAIIGVGTVRLVRSFDAPAQNLGVANLQTNLPANPTRTPPSSTDRDSFNSFAQANSTVPPAKPLKMSFQVLDAVTGYGMPGVRVTAAYFGAGGQGEGEDMLTDDSGIAAIPEPADATKTRGMNVFVVAAGHVPMAVSFPGDDTPAIYSIKLAPAMTAGGLVVDEAGSPVAGVKIMLRGPGVQRGQQASEEFQMCPVTNRADGSWSFGYLPMNFTNEMQFILNKKGYGLTELAVPASGVNLNNLVLVIEQGYTIAGQITDAQHRPVVGAHLKTVSGDRDQRRSTKTDDDGNFTLAGVPPGDLVGPKWTYPPPTLETNASGAFVIRAPHPFYGYSARIKETNEGVVSGAWQNVPWPDAPEPLQVELAIQADGFAPQMSTVQLTNATNIVNFILPAGRLFRGRVVDEAGHAIPHAIVQTDWNNQGIRAIDWDTRTDGNGNFAWNSAPKGPILFWIEADGYAAIRGSAMVADGTDHEIILKRETAQ